MKTKLFISISLLCLILSAACGNKDKNTDSVQSVQSLYTKVDSMQEAMDSLDCILPESEIEFINGQIPGTYHKLTAEELALTKKLLSDTIENAIAKQDSLEKEPFYHNTPLPFNRYIRQYIAVQQKTRLVVWVNLMCISDDPAEAAQGILEVRETNRVIWGKDGGRCLGNALINLTEKQVQSFDLNGDG